ncbi:MAG TPA: CrcB family protein [Homoserinimonas sp.]|nr:CrcB family protein [Homoserinimonas sp.]
MTAALAAAVILCGGVAGVARYLVAVWFSGDTRFPWAVLIVNAVGSALGGAVLGFGSGLSDDIRLVLLTGVAGGLTTFSTFSVETIQLVMDGRARVAVLNIGANLAVGLAVTAVAYALVMSLVG